MTTQHQRDTQLERWLARASKADASDTAACLDGETMAAWVDGALTGPPLKQAREHVAGCARCQAVAAMLLGADQVPATVPADSAGWWRRWMTWVVPMAAAAAAVIAVAVWVRTPTPASYDTAAFDLARSESKPTTESGSAAAATQGQPAAPDPSRRAIAPPQDAPTTNQTSPAGSRNRAFPAPGATATMAARAREERLDETMPAAAAATVAAGSADASVPTVASTADRATATVASTPATPFLASADGLAKPQASAATTAPAAAARMAAPAPAVPTPQNNDAAASGWTVVSSPSGTPRWRFFADQLQASKDGGATWRPVSVDGAVAIRAFSVAGAQVCWLVGPSGLVLLTADGDTWARLPFPTRADLVSVAATDARTAVASTADGRQFATTDAGRTWSTR